MLLITGFIHRCLPYCKPDEGEHTMLAYSSVGETEESIRCTLRDRQGLTVIRAAIEPDAPPYPDTRGVRPFAKAWLVTWRSPACNDG
jgi:hypothetical protein